MPNPLLEACQNDEDLLNNLIVAEAAAYNQIKWSDQVESYVRNMHRVMSETISRREDIRLRDKLATAVSGS